VTYFDTTFDDDLQGFLELSKFKKSRVFSENNFADVNFKVIILHVNLEEVSKGASFSQESSIKHGLWIMAKRSNFDNWLIVSFRSSEHSHHDYFEDLIIVYPTLRSRVWKRWL